VVLSVPNLGHQILAQFEPKSLVMPGVSSLTLSLAPGVTQRMSRDLIIQAVAVPMGVENAPGTSVSEEVRVIFTPSEPSEQKQRTVLRREIPIYLTTDASLMEQVGDVVRIGGRVGLSPGVSSVDLFVLRGAGLPFYANVPLEPGDDRFLVEVPVSSPQMLGLWRVGAQLHSLDPDMPVVGRSGVLTIPVGALRTGAKWMRGKRVLAQEEILSALFGNLIIAAGASDSYLREETIQRLVQDRYSEMSKERRFTPARLLVYSDSAFPGDPGVPVTGPLTTQALVERIRAIPPSDPLTVYLVGAAEGVGVFRLSSSETLQANALGSVLTTSQRTGPTLLIIDCDHAAAVGSAIRTASGGNPNLLAITSTGAGEKNIALFGTLPNTGQPFSFSDFFFDQLLAGESLADAFAEASERLAQVQGPVRLQIPQTLPDPLPESLREFSIGAPYVADLETSGVPDNVEPVILTGSETTHLVRGERLTIGATVRDESTAPEALRVIAHVAPGDAPDQFLQFPMEYRSDQEGHEIAIPGFPESVFGVDITADLFTVSILAEDGSGNSADPLVTSVVVSGAPVVWTPSRADINGDGVADADDLLVLRNFWHQQAKGDTSGDGVWGPLDLLLYQLVWHTQWE
jgi:hypothetical protein